MVAVAGRAVEEFLDCVEVKRASELVLALVDCFIEAKLFQFPVFSMKSIVLNSHKAKARSFIKANNTVFAN